MRETQVRSFTLLLAAAALAGVSAVEAADLNYTFVQGGFSQVEVDGADDGDGLFLEGSLGFGTNWLAFAEYSTAEFDAGAADVDFDQFIVGLGGHFPLGADMDFVGKIGYLDVSAEVNTPFGRVSADDTGYMLSGGVRGVVLERIELEGLLEYFDIGDEDDTGIALSALYRFTDLFSLGAKIATADNTDEIGVLARLSF